MVLLGLGVRLQGSVIQYLVSRARDILLASERWRKGVVAAYSPNRGVFGVAFCS